MIWPRDQGPPLAQTINLDHTDQLGTLEHIGIPMVTNFEPLK